MFRTYRKILGIRVLSRLHFAREASHNLLSLATKKRNTQQVQNVSGLIICSRAYVHAADVYYSPAIPLRRMLVEFWTSRVVHVDTYHRQKQSADFVMTFDHRTRICASMYEPRAIRIMSSRLHLNSEFCYLARCLKFDWTLTLRPCVSNFKQTKYHNVCR